MLLGLIFFSTSIFSSEIDSFTIRKKVLDLPSSHLELNRFFNKRLEDATILANSWSNGKECSKDYRDKAILKNLSGPAVPYLIGEYYSVKWVYGINGYLETAVDKGEDPSSEFHFTSYRPEKKDSIYNDITLWESIPINKFIGSVTHYNGLIIGSDKFGHFISEGYELYLEGGFKNLEKVLAYSELLENGVLGLKTSGVYSYGDLSANFMGMTFWENLDSYITCHNNQWKINPEHPFNWDNYISPAWDEGFNPSKYYSKKMYHKIKSKIVNSKDRSLNNQLVRKNCFEAIKFFHRKFKDDSILIINSVISPVCLENYNQKNEFRWISEGGSFPGEQTDFMGPSWWIL